MSCDRHCIKMILESAQLLCTAIHLHGGVAQYKPTHVSHPCTIWSAKTKANWLWLKEYALALCAEYTLRYGKTHKSQAVIESLNPHVIPDGDLTPFAQAMPDEYRRKDGNVVEAYREYYRHGKTYMNKGNGPLWNKIPSRKPTWFEPPIRPARLCGFI
jgi:hypothetical protein